MIAGPWQPPTVPPMSSTVTTPTSTWLGASSMSTTKKLRRSGTGTTIQSNWHGCGRYVEEIFNHENYLPRLYQNDISLLRMDKRITYTPSLIPVCLPSPEIAEVGQNILPKGLSTSYRIPCCTILTPSGARTPGSLWSMWARRRPWLGGAGSGTTAPWPSSSRWRPCPSSATKWVIKAVIYSWTRIWYNYNYDIDRSVWAGITTLGPSSSSPSRPSSAPGTKRGSLMPAAVTAGGLWSFQGQ